MHIYFVSDPEWDGGVVTMRCTCSGWEASELVAEYITTPSLSARERATDALHKAFTKHSRSVDASA